MKTITGQFQYPSGSPAAGATLRLQLSQAATTTGMQVATPVYEITLDSGGNIPANTQIWANDELQPTGIFYITTVWTTAFGIVWGPQNLSLIGTSPINLNAIVPNPVFTEPVYPSNVIGPVTVQGQPTGPGQVLFSINTQQAQWGSGSGIELETNGVANPDQAILNLKSGSNVTLSTDSMGGVTIASTGGVETFDQIGSGTNTTATMTVGSGGTLNATGSGVVNATEINGIPITGTLTHAGQIPISQPGNTTAVWADPLVQGINAAGTAASGVNPVLVAGSDGTNLRNLLTDTGGQLKILVQNFPGTQPVSGTVSINPIPAGSNIIGQVEITDGTNIIGTSAHPVKVDGSGVTQPISASALPLPSGAATSAKQPALGTAGSASTDVITVQGIASMTALKVDGSGVTQPVSGTVTSNQGTAAATASAWPIKVSDGTNVVTVASLTNSKALAVEIVDGSGNQITSFGGGGGGTSSSFGSAFPSTGTAIGASDGTNMQGLLVESSSNKNLRVALYNGTTEVAITGSNALKVDGSAVTQPVSGTVTANAGTGTFAVSAASLPLPSGAATSAKQPALGTAGSASADVITVQGIASMTALKVDGSAVTQPVSGTITANIGSSGSLALDASVTGLQVSQGSTTSGQKGFLLQGAVTTSSPSYTTAQTSPLSLTVAGSLRVDGSAVTQPVNLTKVNGSTISLGSTTSANSVPVVIASDQGAVSVTASGTVTANQGTAAATASAWPTKITDGTNVGAVKAANSQPTHADPSQVVSISPNNSGLPVNLPTIVQKASSISSGSVASLATAFSSNNVQGRSIVVVCGVGNGTTPTISDTAGNTYTKANGVANGTAFNVAVFYAVNIAAGANTITVNNAGTTASIAMEIYEVSGTLQSIPNQPAWSITATGNSGTAATGTVTPFTPNELAFGVVGLGTAAQTITPATGWTNDSGQLNPTTPAGLFSMVSLSQAFGSVASVTPSATFTSEPWAMVVAGFRPVIVGVEGTVRVTDGTNFLPTGDSSARSIHTTIDNAVVVASASNETSTVYNGTTGLTPLFATIAASSSGATTVVSAVGGKRIRVLAYALTSNGAVNAKFQSHVTPTDITGLFYFASNTGVSGAYCPVGHFQTVAGEALDINLSASVAVGGYIVYVTV